MTDEDVKYQIDGAPDEPVTRAEFNEAMQFVGNAFSNVVSEIHAMQEKLSRDFEAQITRQLDEWGRALLDKIDVAVENRQVDLGAAKHEEVLLIKERQQRHEERITALEEDAGVASTH